MLQRQFQEDFQRHPHMQEVLDDTFFTTSVSEISSTVWANLRQNALHVPLSALYAKAQPEIIRQLISRLSSVSGNNQGGTFLHEINRNQSRIVTHNRYSTPTRILCRKGKLCEEGFILSGVGPATSDLIELENSQYLSRLRLFDIPRNTDNVESIPFKNIWIINDVQDFGMVDPLLRTYLAFPDAVVRPAKKIEDTDYVMISEERLGAPSVNIDNTNQPRIDVPLVAREG